MVIILIILNTIVHNHVPPVWKLAGYRMDIATPDVRKDSGETSVTDSVTVRIELPVTLLVFVLQVCPNKIVNLVGFVNIQGRVSKYAY